MTLMSLVTSPSSKSLACTRYLESLTSNLSPAWIAASSVPYMNGACLSDQYTLSAVPVSPIETEGEARNAEPDATTAAIAMAATLSAAVLLIFFLNCSPISSYVLAD